MRNTVRLYIVEAAAEVVSDAAPAEELVDAAAIIADAAEAPVEVVEAPEGTHPPPLTPLLSTTFLESLKYQQLLFFSLYMGHIHFKWLKFKQQSF